MTELNLDAIQARAEAATPGLWTVERWEDFAGRPAYTVDNAVRWREHTNSIDCGPDQETAVFLAASRVDVLALVARIRELEAEVFDLMDEAGNL